MIEELTDVKIYNENFDLFSGFIKNSLEHNEIENNFKTEVVGENLDKRLIVYHESIGFIKQKEIVSVFKVCLYNNQPKFLVDKHYDNKRTIQSS